MNPIKLGGEIQIKSFFTKDIDNAVTATFDLFPYLNLP